MKWLFDANQSSVILLWCVYVPVFPINTLILHMHTHMVSTFTVNHSFI